MPGSSAGSVYVPSSPVVASRASPVATLVATTFAPLTTAPLGSVIVPVMVPLLDCAATGRTKAAKSRSAQPVRRKRREPLRSVVITILDYGRARRAHLPGTDSRRLTPKLTGVRRPLA